MKKRGAIVCLLVILTVLSTSVAGASGLTLIESFPEDNFEGLQPANVAVKLKFSENMTSREAQGANEGKFNITDQEGKPISVDTLYNPDKYPNEIWLQLSETLTADTDYTLKIDGGLISSQGNTLDGPIVLSFSTRDTSADSSGYMALLAVMVVGMIAFTAWNTRREAKKNAGETQDEDKINPYKEARRTGKSVEEIVAQMEKEKAKKNKGKAGTAGRELDDGQEDREGVYRVKERRPISAAGIAPPDEVVSRRERREEAVRQAQKAKKAKQQSSGPKKKGSKQQQKKKK